MSKKQKATDASRFEGNGISYRAKLIGIEDVPEARGDKMCQETIQKLKGAVKTSGQHKQKIFINVTLEGLKIIDSASMSILHTHPVHRISFISRDVTDSRAFGYVCGSGDDSHKFYGIKTANSAENVVLALRELFQTVYEMKKQEMEDAKAKTSAGTENQSEAKDTEAATDARPAESEEKVEQGIKQFKDLDFEETTTTEETSAQPLSAPTSPVSTAAAPAPAASTDPWGMPASAEISTAPTKTASSSALSDLDQLSSPPSSDPFGAPKEGDPFGGMSAFPPAPASAETSTAPTKTSSSSSALSDLEQLSSPPPSSNPFGGMPAFSPAPASAATDLFGMGQPGIGQPSMGQAGMGQPGMAQPGMAQPGMGQPGMAQPGMAQPGMGQPGMAQPGMGQPGMAQPGMAQPGMAQPGMAQPGMAQPGMPFGQQSMMGGAPSVGLPVTKDPFGDPFTTSPAQPQMMGSSGGQFGMQPFGAPFSASMGAPTPAPAPAQPFPGTTAAALGAGGAQPAFGRASPSFSPFGAPAPAAGMGMGPQGGGAVADPFQPMSDNFLQPSKPGGQDEKARPVSPGHANLFDDLVDIKKAGGADSVTKSPKEIFQQLSQTPKKSLNEMKGGGSGGAPQASVVFDHDPFTEDPFGSIDTMLNTIASSDTDPFGSPHLPPHTTTTPSSLPPLPPPSLPHPPPAPPDPSSAQPDLTLSAPSSKESSPETRFDVPDEPPPPLPTHLMLSAAAPSPPPRPPPIPNRPMPKTQKNSPGKSVSRSFSTPPPLPTTPRPSPRPSSSIASSSSPASELSASDTAPQLGVEGFKETQPFPDTWAQNSPRVSRAQPPPSPSHSWGSSGSLSHSSSQKSLERVVITANSDDPFRVPLRSKKSFSSADGASSKRSSRSSSSGKLSVKSDSKVSVAVDPFGVPLKDRTSACEETGSKAGGVGSVDNPFSSPAFSDTVSVGSSSTPWEAFGDHPGNGVTHTEKSVAVAPNGQRADSSPFGDSFFSTPINGKPSDAQS
ncbi:uncharacterized protein LOC143279711 isoform X2 [Babylonia areolata]|uniref:uncharacterized protein LOC143279711 isoform X2 n=1 Tax=Babylonia areolata TaxID=304850 RepID=UPI003FD593E8